MINKLNTSSRLYLLVFVMSFFIIGIGVYGIKEMKTMNQNTQTLYADRVLPMEQITKVRYAYAVGIISSAEQSQTHRLTCSEAAKEILKAVEMIKINWKEYLLTYQTPEEVQLAEETSALMNQSARIVQKLKDILDKEDTKALDTIINNELYPAVNPVIAQLNELFDLQVRVGRDVYKNNTKIYSTVFKKFALLIILSLIFAILFSYYLIRSIKGLIKNLAESERKYRNIFENVQDVFYQTSLTGIILDVSPSIKNHLGYTRDELIGTSAANLFYDPADREKGLNLLWEKGEIKDYELRFRSNTGAMVYVSLNAVLIPDAHGNPNHQDGSFRNITERKRAEENIKQSEANYRQLFKLSPAPMWVLDEKTYRFMQVNQACIVDYGYSEEEFATMTIGNISPQDSLAGSGGSKSQSTTFFKQGHRHIKKSGEMMDVETSSIPVILNGQKQILVIAIDVTEKNLYEQKLTRAAIKAQEDERYEIGGELHDNVCQILATSLMTLGMMRNSLPPQSKELFDRTNNYIALASREVRNLSHRLAPAFFDEASLEDAFSNLLENFNVERKYKIALNFDRPSKVYAISRDLQLNLYRILQEQLRNILKYAHATNIEVDVRISDNALQMRVRDNGVGFDVESIQGGIGFANMNRRAQLFSGNFSVDAAVGNGCEILVSAPLVISN